MPILNGFPQGGGEPYYQNTTTSGQTYSLYTDRLVLSSATPFEEDYITLNTAGLGTGTVPSYATMRSKIREYYGIGAFHFIQCVFAGMGRTPVQVDFNVDDGTIYIPNGMGEKAYLCIFRFTLIS